MLLRCNVDEISGLIDLDRCRAIGAFFATRGHRVAFAVNREGYESARAYLGKDATLYRIPTDENEDVERLAHLGRTHKHRVLFVYLRRTTSAYLFHVRRHFQFLAVIDAGSSHLMYGNILINPGLGAHEVAYNCTPDVKLLLGPKFHICDPVPVEVPRHDQPIEKILLNVTSASELLRKLCDAIFGLEKPPQVHVMVGAADGVSDLIEDLAAHYSEGMLQVVRADGAFAYHHYPLIITEATPLCMDHAHQGLVFLNLAYRREQLKLAYMLEQLGISPTLGWHEAQKVVAIQAKIAGLLGDRDRRAAYSRAGRKLVDGQGLLRIARFVPAE